MLYNRARATIESGILLFDTRHTGISIYFHTAETNGVHFFRCSEHGTLRGTLLLRHMAHCNFDICYTTAREQQLKVTLCFLTHGILEFPYSKNKWRSFFRCFGTWHATWHLAYSTHGAMQFRYTLYKSDRTTHESGTLFSDTRRTVRTDQD